MKKLFGVNAALIIVGASFMPEVAAGKEAEQTIIQAPETPLTTQISTRYPVDSIKITQGYYFFHPAYDLDGITGDPIHPIRNGVVESVEYSRFAYGNAVYINHGEGLVTLYAHLSKINVKKGDIVTTNDIIGEMGATGRAFGDHLHFEVYENGKNISPYSVLPR